MRLIAFVLSATLVGVGGGLYAQFLGILTVDPFYLSLSFITIAMLVVGGMASLTGAVTGVVAVTAIVELLRFMERGVTLGGTLVPAAGQPGDRPGHRHGADHDLPPQRLSRGREVR